MARLTKREVGDIRIARMMGWLWTLRALIPVGALALLFSDAAMRDLGGPLATALPALFGTPGLVMTAVLFLLCLIPFISRFWKGDAEPPVRVGLNLLWILLLWPVAVLVASPGGPLSGIAAPRGIPPAVWSRGVLPGVLVLAAWATCCRSLTAAMLRKLGFGRGPKPASLSSKPAPDSGKTPVL